MAKRIHVFAFRNTTPEVIRTALAPLGEIEVQAVNGWCWFSTSVWGLAADKILEPLAGLDGPLLFITTEDACRWYLRLRAKDREPYLTVHNFPPSPQDVQSRDREDFNVFQEDYEGDYGKECVTIEIGHPPIPDSTLPPLEFRDPFFEPYLEADDEDDDWDEDDDDESDSDDSPLAHLRASYTELGIPLREDLIGKLDTLPDDEVYGAFYELHAMEISEALDRFDIPHDRPTVLDALTGRSVTPVESDWDIGNLPRFLAALKFGAYFDDMVADAERQYREILAQEPEDYSKAVLKKMGGVNTVPLADGPLKVSAEDGPLLFRAGYYTHEQVEAAFTAELPAGEGFAPTEPVPSYVSIHENNGRLAIGVLTNDVFLATTSCQKLGKTLADLPTGTVLTMHLSGLKALRQQFRGTIAEGEWIVESATAPLDANTLQDALELFRTGLARRPIVARDEAELEAVLEAVKADYWLHETPVTRDDLALSAPRRFCNALATLFFRHRFGHVWDCSKAIAENEENLAKWHGIAREMDAEERLPITDTVVLNGQASVFFEADLKSDSLDDNMKREIENVPALVEAQAALGLQYLGNLVCKKIGGCILCCFADVSGHAYAIHYIMPFGMTWKDCYSICKDGTSLTTTNGQLDGSIPNLRILTHKSDAQDFAGLFAAHRKGLNLFRRHGIVTTPVEPTLAGVAAAIDDFLVKRLADE